MIQSMGEAVRSLEKDCRHNFFYYMIPIIGTQIMDNNIWVVSRPWGDRMSLCFKLSEK